MFKKKSETIAQCDSCKIKTVIPVLYNGCNHKVCKACLMHLQ